MGMEWDGAAAVWMRRVCSHSRQCGLAAKVSGRQGRAAQPEGNRHTVGSPSPNQSSHAALETA